jgi:hypothetical protein
VAGSYKHGNDHSASINGGQFLSELKDSNSKSLIHEAIIITVVI